MLKDEELVSGYFRPVTGYITLLDKDKKKSVTMMVDRPVAATSRVPGQIEFIYDRKFSTDDKRGINRMLNDTNELKGTFTLFFSMKSSFEDIRKVYREQVSRFPIKMITLIEFPAKNHKTPLESAKPIPSPPNTNTDNKLLSLLDIYTSIENGSQAIYIALKDPTGSPIKASIKQLSTLFESPVGCSLIIVSSVNDIPSQPYPCDSTEEIEIESTIFLRALITHN